MDCYNPDREYNTTLPEFVIQDKDNPSYWSPKKKKKTANKKPTDKDHNDETKANFGR